MYRDMKKKKNKKAIIFAALALTINCLSADAESLFLLNATNASYVEPRPLYASVRARTVGDLVTIIFNERVNVNDQGKFSSNRDSTATDRFSGFINGVFKRDLISTSPDNYGGAISTDSGTTMQRSMTFTDRASVQVVQMLPNGNLVVQGKKSLVNANERVDVLISGVIDPRKINEAGEISSQHVANLQFAMNGRGSVSRGQNEGIINRFLRYLF